MVDYQDSSQLNLWTFESDEQLLECRTRANREAILYLEQRDKDTPTPLPIHQFACGYAKNSKNENTSSESNTTPVLPDKYLTPAEEAVLVQFYISKLPALVGPKAVHNRLRRDYKVTATACMLLRRFFHSNSCHLYNPKVFMTAAAFIATKVEDVTADIRHVQAATQQLQAAVEIPDILSAEVGLLQGTHFDLMCFHPFKAVQALTEDLRTFLKSEKGQKLITTNTTSSEAPRQDLRPLYETAKSVLEDFVILSDLPALYNPGILALASLVYAQQKLNLSPSIDFKGYVECRFVGVTNNNNWHEEYTQRLFALTDRIKTLAENNGEAIDLVQLKRIHKKLKKVQVWQSSSSEKSSKKRKVPDE